MIVPYLKLEKERELRDSVVLARSRFLTVIRELKPQVIVNLYTSTFPDFVFSVAEHFREQLIDKRQATETSAFLLLSQQIIQNLEARHQPPGWQELDQSTRELIDVHRPRLVIDHLRGKLTQPLLIDLVNIPLMRAFSHLMQLGESEIGKALPDWRTVVKLSHCVGLTESLIAWAMRWNLDAEWCRGHALRVLRQWLMDDPLRWTFLYADQDPPIRNSRLAAHWLYAARYNEFAVGWSQAILSGEVFKGDPEEFSFERQKLKFTASGFNPIIESAGTWKRNLELDFRTHLYKTELNRLEDLKTNQNEVAELENKFSGALDVFKKEVLQHIERVTRKLKDAESSHGLLKVKEKRDRDKHISWAIRYQIPKTDSQGYELESEIAEDAEVSESAVSKAVTATLQEIDLPIRARTPKGRGDLSKRILRQLGR